MYIDISIYIERYIGIVGLYIIDIDICNLQYINIYLSPQTQLGQTLSSLECLKTHQSVRLFSSKKKREKPHQYLNQI